VLAADDSILWSFRLCEQPGLVVDGALDQAHATGTARPDAHGGESDILALLPLNSAAEAGA
jgi:hypothetical protein